MISEEAVATIAIAHYNDAGACDRDSDGVTTTDPGRWKIVMAPDDDLKKDVATVE